MSDRSTQVLRRKSKPWPLSDLIMAARILGFVYLTVLISALFVPPWLPLGILSCIVLFFMGVRWATQGRLKDAGNLVMAGGAISLVIGPFFWPTFLGVTAIPIGWKIRTGGSLPKTTWRSYDPARPQSTWLASPALAYTLVAMLLGQALIRFFGTTPTRGIIPLVVATVLIVGQIAQRNAPKIEPGQKRTSITSFELLSLLFRGLALLAGAAWSAIASLSASGSARVAGLVLAGFLLLLFSLNCRAWLVARKLPRAD